MTKLGEKEKALRALRVKTLRGVDPTKAVLVPPRRPHETNEELKARSVLIHNLEKPKAPFDRKAYQREYMRRWRAKRKERDNGKA